MRNLAGKYCIVTGAGKGIGKAIAKRFIEEEAAGVAILEYDEALAEATAKELDPTGKKVIAVRCNVADGEMVRAAVDTVVATFGRVDVLINNAGITRDKIFHKMTDDDWFSVVNVNLNGTYNLCKCVVPLMRDQESGAIVNIASTSLMGNPGQANYAASKAGIVGFTKSVAKELGSRTIRCNAIAPGFIETDMTAALNEEQKKTIVDSIPLKRAGHPEDVANTAVFLASKASDFVNGQVIYVDGGIQAYFGKFPS